MHRGLGMSMSRARQPLDDGRELLDQPFRRGRARHV
jgi:hypothetical protein